MLNPVIVLWITQAALEQRVRNIARQDRSLYRNILKKTTLCQGKVTFYIDNSIPTVDLHTEQKIPETKHWNDYEKHHHHKSLLNSSYHLKIFMYMFYITEFTFFDTFH